MTSTILFYIILAIILLHFIIDQVLEHLNTKCFQNPLPEPLKDVYNAEEYQKSQQYKKEKNRFAQISSWTSFVGLVLFLCVDGFAILDDYVRQYSTDPVVITLLFFGVLYLFSDIITTPFSYYTTFVIEEKFGFNKMSIQTFWMDKLKGLLLAVIIGGILLSLMVGFYLKYPTHFWIYAWIVMSVFSLVMNIFYTTLIVPLFNKQEKLEQGNLRTAIAEYANSVGFHIQNIYVIDGSKRSTKANAYFSGFGNQKQITLYDTLISDLEQNEIIAVLAHEVGHYKHKHILYNLLLSILITGFTLWVLSILIKEPMLASALGVNQHSFHIGLVAFAFLYTPISAITGWIMNALSRVFEYQADNYAKKTFDKDSLISSLKKLSQNSFSNLTPHPLYVAVNYSHPSLLQRINNLKK